MGTLGSRGRAPDGCKQHLSLPWVTAHLADPPGSRGTRGGGVWRRTSQKLGGQSIQPLSSPPEAKVGSCSRVFPPPGRTRTSARHWGLGPAPSWMTQAERVNPSGPRCPSCGASRPAPQACCSPPSWQAEGAPHPRPLRSGSCFDPSFTEKETESQKIKTNYRVALMLCQALVLSISHQLIHLTVTTALPPLALFWFPSYRSGNRGPSLGAGARVRTPVILTWGVGLNSGASVAPVDFNQVPWGRVFGCHAFASHTWPGCAGGWGPAHL